MKPKIIIILRGGCVVRVARTPYCGMEKPVVEIIDCDNLGNDGENMPDEGIHAIIAEATAGMEDIY